MADPSDTLSISFEKKESTISFKKRDVDTVDTLSITFEHKKRRLEPSPPPFEPPVDLLPPPLQTSTNESSSEVYSHVQWKAEKHWGLFHEYGGIKAYLKQHKSL